MASRPKIKQTKSSSYRPMTQMNGDFLTQLKKPVCSELNANFRGSMRAREEHCKQQVRLWYKDQAFTVRRLDRSEEKTFCGYLQVQREKRKLAKSRRQRRKQSSSKADKDTCDEVGIRAVTHSETDLEKTVFEKAGFRRINRSENVKEGKREESGDNMITHSGNMKPHVAQYQHSKPEVRLEGLKEDLEGCITKHYTKPKADTNISASNLSINLPVDTEDNDTLYPIQPCSHEDHDRVSVCRKSRTQSLPSIYSQTHALVNTDKDIDERSLSKLEKSHVKSVDPIHMERNRVRALEMRRKTILDNEPLRMYCLDDKGEVIPSFKSFKRKLFALPTITPVKERKKFLQDVKKRQTDCCGEIESFLQKLELEKGYQEQFIPKRRVSTEELVLREPKSMGRVSLERLATIFDHRNKLALPEGVDPGSIAAMRQCTYIRSHNVLDDDVRIQKAKNQTKHIFQQNFKITVLD